MGGKEHREVLVGEAKDRPKVRRSEGGDSQRAFGPERARRSGAEGTRGKN